MNVTGNNPYFDNAKNLIGNIYRFAVANFCNENFIYFSLGTL